MRLHGADNQQISTKNIAVTPDAFHLSVVLKICAVHTCRLAEHSNSCAQTLKPLHNIPLILKSPTLVKMCL